MVLTFESMDEILKCDHLNESYWAVHSCVTVYYAVQGGSNFWVYGWNPMVWPFKWKLLSSTFLWYCLLCCTRWLSVTFESVNEILKCDHSKKSYRAWAVLSGGAAFMLYKVVLLSLSGISRYNHSSESFCEHYFVVLFTVLLNVVPTFELVRNYGDSNKSYWAVLSCGVMGTFLCYP